MELSNINANTKCCPALRKSLLLVLLFILPCGEQLSHRVFKLKQMRRVYPLDALPNLRPQVTVLRTYPIRVVDGHLQVGMPKQAT